MFHQGDLQSAITLAVQQSKAVLCFVKDDTRTSEDWVDVLNDISELIQAETVAICLTAGSQEAGFLSSYRPLTWVPTVVLIKSGVVQLHLWAEGPDSVTLEQLKVQLEGALRKDDATPVSQSTLPASTAISNVNPNPQVYSTNSTPAGPAAAAASTAPGASESPHSSPNLRSSTVPLTATAQTISPRVLASQAQQSPRTDYLKMQREREQKERDERDRIKQQIKIDREERRRREGAWKEAPPKAENMSASSPAPKSHDIRVQVRTFDGSTLRQTFRPSANITSDIRPWIDSNSSQSMPYDLKLILTPLPNRNIEAAEEEHSLVDLGIQRSCTLVMVPVKGYVESYTGSTAGGIVGSAVTGGYNIVTGTAQALVDGVKSLLGWTSQPSDDTSATVSASSRAQEDLGRSTQNVRVRTLADQRIEAAKKNDQQFYNGNQLNFQPREDEGKDD